VARVRAANSHEEAIVLRQVGSNVPFALASVTPTDEDIDEALLTTPVESESRGSPSKDVVASASRGVDDDIGNGSKRLDLCLGWVRGGSGVVCCFATVMRTPSESSCEDGLRCRQVDMNDAGPECGSYRLDLFCAANGIHQG
jgi:hypothetical protein